VTSVESGNTKNEKKNKPCPTCNDRLEKVVRLLTYNPAGYICHNCKTVFDVDGSTIVGNLF